MTYQLKMDVVSLLKTSSVVDVGRRISELRPVVYLSTTTELYGNWLCKVLGKGRRKHDTTPIIWAYLKDHPYMSLGQSFQCFFSQQLCLDFRRRSSRSMRTQRGGHGYLYSDLFRSVLFHLTPTRQDEVHVGAGERHVAGDSAL